MRPIGSPPQHSEDANAVWAILSSMISGLVVWGGAGALADHLLHVQGVFLAVGVLLGMTGALYGVVIRYGRAPVAPTRRRKGV